MGDGWFAQRREADRDRAPLDDRWVLWLVIVIAVILAAALLVKAVA